MPRLRRAEVALDAAALGSMPLPSDEGDGKRSRGTVLVVGGSSVTPGAALLAGVAALRIGAGRLQIATDPAVVPMLGVAVPEALVTSYHHGTGGHDGNGGHDGKGPPPLRSLVAAADAIVVGPGLGDLGLAGDLLDVVLTEAPPGVPVVVDALAIDAVTARDGGVGGRASVIVTPNREELDRLGRGIDTGGDAEQRVARACGVIVVSFGRIATGTDDGRTWSDQGDVTGLGTSGAGDVLAGAVAGLAARCGDAVTASCWATVCHRVAANRLAERVGPVGYLARELADELPAALEAVSQDARSASTRPR